MSEKEVPRAKLLLTAQTLSGPKNPTWIDFELWYSEAENVASIPTQTRKKFSRGGGIRPGHQGGQLSEKAIQATDDGGPLTYRTGVLLSAGYVCY
ncbi:Protein of unknown function [Gryllus bimaculatus]|nr:Protein of unknown function [Gryllus bimaculatus]